MNDCQKKRFDAIETLRKAAWGSFDRRRDFEWKVAIPLWTAMAAFVGMLLTGRVQELETAACVGVALTSIAVFVLHVRFVVGSGRANRFDIRAGLDLESKMREIAAAKLPPDLQKESPQILKATGRWWHWSHSFQWGTTAILAAAAIAASWSLAAQPMFLWLRSRFGG